MKPAPKKLTADIQRTLIERAHEDIPTDIATLRTKLWNIEVRRSEGMTMDELYQKFGNKNSEGYFSAVNLFAEKYWKKHEQKSNYEKESAREYISYLSTQQPRTTPNEFFDDRI